MRIEKINSNQIKCVLDKKELESRHINVGELAYGSEKAQELFKDMMQKASYEFGFESGDAPLMIEAVPLSSDGIMLIITKVDHLDDLDDNYTGLPRTFRKRELASKKIKKETPLISNSTSESDSEDTLPFNAFFVYSFKSLDYLINAVKSIQLFPFLSSRVYKQATTHPYMLRLHSNAIAKSHCLVVRGLLSEYGEAVHCRKAKLNYFDEHYEIFIKDYALDKLLKIG